MGSRLNIAFTRGCQEELIEAIQSATKDNLLLTIVRDGMEQTVKVRRVKTAAGDYELLRAVQLHPEKSVLTG